MKKNNTKPARLTSLHSLEQELKEKKGTVTFDTAIQGLGVTIQTEKEVKKKKKVAEV
ncbi:MAG: hypothetical protein M9916_10715 [Crocinitomicaceae bacterium]|nr:hypothetical protein [Crocinitomicaceae bacterium]